MSEDEKDFDDMNPPRRKIEDVYYAYYPVRYIQGTVCDITNQPRSPHHSNAQMNKGSSLWCSDDCELRVRAGCQEPDLLL